MKKALILALAAMTPGAASAQQPTVIPISPTWMVAQDQAGQLVRLQVIGVVVAGAPAPTSSPPAWSEWASPLEQAQLQAQAAGRVLTPVERNAAINAHLRQFASEQQARLAND